MGPGYVSAAFWVSDTKFCCILDANTWNDSIGRNGDRLAILVIFGAEPDILVRSRISRFVPGYPGTFRDIRCRWMIDEEGLSRSNPNETGHVSLLQQLCLLTGFKINCSSQLRSSSVCSFHQTDSLFNPLGMMSQVEMFWHTVVVLEHCSGLTIILERVQACSDIQFFVLEHCSSLFWNGVFVL